MKLPHTPVEIHEGFAVKREDLCCPDIPISKMRGLYRHIEARPEPVIAVTDTFRSWNGLCAAIVCKHLGKHCLIFYPDYKRGKRAGKIPLIQQWARDRWDAELIPCPANRQAQMLYFTKTYLELLDDRNVFVLNTGFRFEETAEQVAHEFVYTFNNVDPRMIAVVVPTGTGTHLKGVVRGAKVCGVHVIAVLGYSQNHARLRKYVGGDFELIDESYEYQDKIELDLPFDANPYYETKAWQWMKQNLDPSPQTVLWNIGGRWAIKELADILEE